MTWGLKTLLGQRGATHPPVELVDSVHLAKSRLAKKRNSLSGEDGTSLDDSSLDTSPGDSTALKSEAHTTAGCTSTDEATGVHEADRVRC